MQNNIIKILLTAALAISFTAPAYADWNNYHRTRGYWGGPEVVIAPAPVYVGPPPVVYAAPPPPPPVVLYNPAQPYVQVRCNNAAITGTVIGGVAGGLIGSQFGHGRHRGFPIVGGTLIGALIGNQIGQANETCAAQALEYAAPNTQVVWQSNGAQYMVDPVKTYQENGQTCREYQTKVIIGGQQQDAYGTACRQPDGSWKPVNQ
jgi:surface antigen